MKKPSIFGTPEEFAGKLAQFAQNPVDNSKPDNSIYSFPDNITDDELLEHRERMEETVGNEGL